MSLLENNSPALTHRNTAAERLPILIVLALLATSSFSQQRPQEPELFLTKHLGFSHDQIMQVKHGAVVAKILKPEKHEVAAVVAARINAPREFFVARFRDIERHKKSANVLQVRRFSDSAQAGDLADLTLLPQEVRDLEGCRPGQCLFKLSSNQIALIREQLGSSAPDIGERASAAVRGMLAGYVRGYKEAGNKAMIEYNDKQEVVATQKQFAELLETWPGLAEYAPEFQEYLRKLPDTALSGVERFFYWSREKYSDKLKPAIVVTEVSIYQRPAGKSPAILIASKQIYASHYFEASLGLTMLFEPKQGDPSSSFYLVYMNRSRIDLLRKWYSAFARERLSESVRSSARKSMFELRSKVEDEYQASQPGKTAPLGEALPMTDNSADYHPGDLVTWDLGRGLTDVGIVVDRKGSGGRFMVEHTIGAGPKIEDVLFDWKIIGHYRYLGPPVKVKSASQTAR